MSGLSQVTSPSGVPLYPEDAFAWTMEGGILMSPSALAERGYAQGQQDGYASGYGTGVRDGKAGVEAVVGSLLKGETLRELDRTVSETNRGLNKLWRKLGGTLVALAAALTAFGNVATVRFGDLRESSRVVTNVTGFATSAELDEAVRDVSALPTEIPPEAAARGVSFVDLRHGVETQNCAVVIGAGAVGAVSDEDAQNAPNNKVLRSVSVVIGGGAYAKTSGTTAQSVAIGWYSRATGQNSIAIGSAPTHPDERFIGEDNEKPIGDSTEATGGQAIALGYSAKATGKMSIGVGDHARATAKGAVQLGAGDNAEENTLQFRDYKLLDAAGQIPTNRLVAAVASMTGGVLDGIERAVKSGNTTAICNGLDVDTSGHPVIEPRLDGISEVEIQPDTNGVYTCGTEVEVMPPMGSRNYDIVVREIPQFVGVTNGVEYALPPERNFLLSFAELFEPRQVEVWCDSSIGYTNGLMVVLTNAPCIVKVREPSTNRLYCVVKPWSLAVDL